MKVSAPVTTATSTLEQVRGTQSPTRTRETAAPTTDLKSAHGYLNQTIGDIDNLRNVKIDPSVFRNIISDMDVDKATRGNFLDNGTARELKDDYKNLYDSAREQQKATQGLVDSLGPGEHKLLDGSTVNVKKNKDGSTTVITTRPDGSQDVAELSQDTSKFSFTSTDADGNSTTTERDGSTVSTTDGKGGKTEYSVDDNGNAERRTSHGPFGSTRVRVNSDGSTDTWESQMCHPPRHSHQPSNIGNIKPLNHEFTGN